MEFWPVVLLAGIIAILFALWLARNVLSQDKGPKAMQEVAGVLGELIEVLADQQQAA